MKLAHTEENSNTVTDSSFGTWLKSMIMLGKLRLSFLVVFSAVVTYLTGLNGSADVFLCCILGLGGMLVTMSANALNQIQEQNYDALMQRTHKRPLPEKKITDFEAYGFAMFTGLLGSFLLHFYFGILTSGISVLSLLLYAYVYTPMKRWTSFAVFVGAIPGALPTLIGWVAATQSVNLFGWTLFAIQFIWQFPHFWAIAWIAFEDYKKAGFHLLPSRAGRDVFSALQMLVYSILLIPIGLIPWMSGLTGILSAVLLTFFAILIIVPNILLVKSLQIRDARRVLWACFLYLPVVQLIILFNLK